VYFAKGNDPRLLNIQQQLEISEFVRKDNLSSSLLVYNPLEALKKITAWKQNLPWIKPFYAIKSSPCMELIRDFAGKGAGMDCASKHEIEVSLNAGVLPKDIVYSNPIKN
jgi:diaminopimelate decarboxylase